MHQSEEEMSKQLNPIAFSNKYTYFERRSRQEEPFVDDTNKRKKWHGTILQYLQPPVAGERYIT